MGLQQTPLLTDLYQLTMLQSYLDQQMSEPAVFEFFVRQLPAQRNFLIAAGLEQLIQFLQHARFSDQELEYLEQTGLFKDNLIDYLRDFRFSGSLTAMAEGTLCFANEPLVRVTAPLPEAQLIESRLINILQFQTLVSSKAVRCRLAAPDKQLIDFGLRRTHGAEAGLWSARACYLAGFDGSSNVLAGQRFGIPIMGTMAHSYIQAHLTEEQAFLHFAESLPASVILLIDTYDTARSARKVVGLAARLANRGIEVKAIRIDSGDLIHEARRVRSILDQGHCQHIRIIASGDVDEYLLQHVAELDAPIDSYGIGTRITTSADAPYLDCAYKLQEYAGIARRKRSHGKATWPGPKQVYRCYDEQGLLQQDLLCHCNEKVPRGQPLLQPLMEAGRLLRPVPTLEAIRQSVADNLATLPARLRRLEPAPGYEIEVSAHLRELADQTDARFAGS